MSSTISVSSAIYYKFPSDINCSSAIHNAVIQANFHEILLHSGLEN